MIESVRNLTPHLIHVYRADGTVEVIPPEDEPARVDVSRELVETIDGVPVYAIVFGAVRGLPPPEDGVWYLVSVVTAKAAPNRRDLLITDDAVRDSDGRIIGCRAFAVTTPMQREEVGSGTV